MPSKLLWEGESRLAPLPIALVATGIPGPRGGRGSKNRKTGGMIQLWIVPSHVSAAKAVLSGDDRAVCGDCKLRPLLARARGAKLAGKGKETCYLTSQIWRGHGPTAITTSLGKGKYTKALSEDVKKITQHVKGFRWGAWGDPLALPLEVLKHDPLVSQLTMPGARHTAYTHQWRGLESSDAEWVQGWCMASVDTVEDAQVAMSQGWRYYRVRKEREDLIQGEKICPASKEGNHVLTCAECRQCDGKHKGAKRSNYVIISH